MKAFPMFIRTTDRRVVIVGGGEQAAQKARLMLKTDAKLVFVAFDLDDEVAAIVNDGRAEHETHLSAEVFDDAAMAFIATECPALDSSAHALARAAARCPVNVVDRPELCDLTTPAIVDRDPVVIAIGSEGTAPILTREIKTQIEVMLSPRLGALAALAGRLRPAVARSLRREDRRRFWTWFFTSTPRAAWTRGAEREAAAITKTAIAKGKTPEDEPAAFSIIEGSVRSTDLLTLRMVKRLQDADVIFCDAETNSDILELARRDAARVHVNADSRFAGGLSGLMQAHVKPGQSAVWIANRATFSKGVGPYAIEDHANIEVLAHGHSSDHRSDDAHGAAPTMLSER
ncbi:NAD(P)-dependent oxidoreductase [Pseudooceanicola sp. MF1-13]|uniref:precorrin-2 dehydrogenase/sirohydrochlorin ferrochelatase family protein n=1 Tax=Pseudooceanicola sp. MF1-13 TaxID=3379095 RepID=UPI003892C1FE